MSDTSERTGADQAQESQPATKTLWDRHGSVIIALIAAAMLVLLLALNMN